MYGRGGVNWRSIYLRSNFMQIVMGRELIIEGDVMSSGCSTKCDCDFTPGLIEELIDTHI